MRREGGSVLWRRKRKRRAQEARERQTAAEKTSFPEQMPPEMGKPAYRIVVVVAAERRVLCTYDIVPNREGENDGTGRTALGLWSELVRQFPPPTYRILVAYPAIEPSRSSQSESDSGEG